MSRFPGGLLCVLSGAVLMAGIMSVPVSAKTLTVRSAGALKSADPAPGDTVVFLNGYYDDLSLRVAFSGTEKSPVTFRAQTPGGVVLRGRSNLKVSGSHLNVEGFLFRNPSIELSYVIVAERGTTDIHFRECCVYGDGDVEASAKKRSKWLCLYGTCHEVERCSFDGKRNIGLMVDVCFDDSLLPPHTTVHNCYFSHPYTIRNSKGFQINGQEAFRFGIAERSMDDAQGVCRDNWFNECNGEIEVISSKSSGNLYENNLFENCKGELTLRHGNRNIVRRNIFLSDGDKESGGVRIIGGGHVVEDNYMQGLGGHGNCAAICVVGANPEPDLNEYWPADNCIIRRNTVVDCREGLYVNFENHLGGPVAPNNLRVEKNVFSLGQRSRSVIVNKMDPDDVRWKKNIIFGGTQEGASLKESRKSPVLPDVSGRADDIRKGAGVSYGYKTK